MRLFGVESILTGPFPAFLELSEARLLEEAFESDDEVL